MQFVRSALPGLENACDGQELQPEDEFDPAPVEYVPLAQKTHGTDPFTALYVPGTQRLQLSPPVPVYPGAQRQTLLPLDDFEFMGHGWQVEKCQAPIWFE